MSDDAKAQPQPPSDGLCAAKVQPQVQPQLPSGGLCAAPEEGDAFTLLSQQPPSASLVKPVVGDIGSAAGCGGGGASTMPAVALGSPRFAALKNLPSDGLFCRLYFERPARTGTASLVELVDVASIASIERAWASAARHFAIEGGAARMQVLDPYITVRMLRPTVDDLSEMLQRYIEQSDADLSRVHFRLQISQLPPPPDKPNPGPTPPMDGGGMVGGLMGEVRIAANLLQIVNQEMTARLRDKGGSSTTVQTAEMFALLGMVLGETLRAWHLFAQAPSTEAKEFVRQTLGLAASVHPQGASRSGDGQPLVLGPLFSLLPSLERYHPFVTKHRPELVRLVRLLAAAAGAMSTDISLQAQSLVAMLLSSQNEPKTQTQQTNRK